MRLKVFDLRLDEEGRLDDADMAAFLEDKEVLEASEHFFVHEHRPRFVVMVRYRESKVVVGKREASDTKGRKDWRTTLSEEEQVLYDRLRIWRKIRAREEGVPPYLIFSNEQMAEIVRAKPQSEADLQQIEGLGKRTVERYGADILQCLYGASETKSAQNTENS